MDKAYAAAWCAIDEAAAASAIVESAVAGLRSLCSSAGVDESHGIGHALKVLGHLDRAIEGYGAVGRHHEQS